jgi:MYXO-CTERM domain-containing protein
MLLWVLIAGVADAAPHTSQTQSVTFVDRVDAFDSVSRKFGPYPSSSLGVEFTISSLGHTRTEIPASSHLVWPDALTQSFTGGAGKFDVDLKIDVAARVIVSMWGITGGYNIWNHTININTSSPLSGLMLPGSPSNSVSVTRSGDVLASYGTWLPISGDFGIEFYIDAVPSLFSKFSGIRIETGDAWVTYDAERALHDVPGGTRRALNVGATYVGELRSKLDLVLRPEFALCEGWLGFCYWVGPFDVPIAIVDDVEQRSFGKHSVSFPLPVLKLPREGHYFGEVGPGGERVYVLDVENDGDLRLELDMEIDGDPAFRVHPAMLNLQPRQTAQVQVTYNPTKMGGNQAALIFLSNDPLHPERVFSLSGDGVDGAPIEEPGEDDVDDPTVPGGNNFVGDGGVPELDGSGCGCSSATSAGFAGWLVTLMGLFTVAARRRGGR